jgi:3,4-dihydroxy 2-butanone 4-phosphate synthase/GTP cyclohydrolase II
MSLSSIEEIIEDVRQGKMVILVDDEDRENEGDLLMAAEHVRPEDINFMARYGRGLICLTLTRERCEQLQLPLMVSDNNARHSTNFTVSIEAAEGVTTGISAADRATTVQAAVKRDARASDVVQPGHIFPLMAQPGGVLTRAGHTEAGVDLARLAGVEPASVICEILKEDGSMARLPELVEFAREHGLKVGAIADLIRYRLEHEATVERVSECRFPTVFGDFRLLAYHDTIDGCTHLALIKGTIERDAPTLVRVQLHTGMFDRLADFKKPAHWPLGAALERIGAAPAGVVVLIDRQDSPAALVRRIRHFQMEDMGIEFPWQTDGSELRMVGIGAQILVDCGVGKMRVLGTPKKVHSLSGFDLDIVEYLDQA